MAFLSRDHIREMVKTQKLVEGYDDLEGQMTANGFDVRVGAIIEMLKAGRLAINKNDNKPPVLGTGWVLEGFEHWSKTHVIKKMMMVRIAASPNKRAVRRSASRMPTASMKTAAIDTI